MRAGAIGAGRAEEDFAGHLRGFVADIARGKIRLQFPIKLRHLEDGAVEHRRQTRPEQRAQNLLGFAQ